MLAYEVRQQHRRFANRHSLCAVCGGLVLITQALWRQVMTTGWREVHCPECGALDQEVHRLRNLLRQNGAHFPKSRRQWELELNAAEGKLAARRPAGPEDDADGRK